MPFGGDPLNPEQIAVLKTWIDEGARASRDAAPAQPKWEAPLTLTAPKIPEAAWPTWITPTDRFVSDYFARHKIAEPRQVSDALFARRAYLDIQGLLPSPDQLRAFASDPAADKRTRLVAQLLGDNDKYAENWISFWDDLLRNDEGVNYYSETCLLYTSPSPRDRQKSRM